MPPLTILTRRRTLHALGAAAAGPWLINARGQSPKVIRLAHHVSLQSEQHKAAERFGELLQKYSNGALSVRILPSGQSGGQREIIESVSLGTLEMGYGESSLYANYDPRLGIIALPYLYRDFNHWQATVDGAVGEELSATLLKRSGIRIANWMVAGYRDTFLRTHAVAKPDDFARVKIRLPESPVFVKSFQALGALPTPIPAPEMYSALQTGVVDAMEGSPEVGYTFKIFEVTKYLSRTRHMLLDGSFAINDAFYRGLPQEQRDAFDRAAKECAVAQRKEHFEREANWFGKIKSESKMEVNECDLPAFAAKLAPVQDEFAKAAKATDLIAKIKAL